jgi:uncharacterized repeat protein (TIGR01451 family)
MKTTAALALCLALSVFALGAFASTTTHIYYFNQPTITIQNGQATVILLGAPTWSRVGQPLLPNCPVQLLLPPGEEAVSITAVASAPVVIGDGYRIPHRQQPYPYSMPAPAQPTPPDASVYGSNDPFPADRAGDLQTQFYAGHGIAYGVVWPVAYRPQSGELAYYPSVTVTVESRPTARAQEAYANLLKRNHKANERLSNLVQNPETIMVYGHEEPSRPEGWDMLFIMPENFIPAYQDFVNYKTRSGVMSTIVTTQYIYANYPGLDNQTKIRNCIIDYYTTQDVSYVFLAGDNEHIPHRGLYCAAGYTDSDIAGDLYFAALDGNWNNDGDSYYGEPGEEDYVAEVFIGRTCSDNATEIPNTLNKYMMYQTEPVEAECETALMTGEDLGWPIWAWEYKEEIRLGSSMWGYTTVGFPANFTVGRLYEYPGQYWSAMTDLLPLLNQGPTMVNHLGHGDVGLVMQFSTGNINDVNCTNNGVNHNFYIAYSQACYSGSFDNRTTGGSYTNDCICEEFTTIAHGAVAWECNSRYGWGDLSTTNGPSQPFDRQFFDALFAENRTTLGDMNGDSKEDNIWMIPSDNTIRWCYYELNLLGDPSMDVWTDDPGVFFPTFNAVALLGSQTFQVTSISVPNALVTISLDNVVLGQANANVSGVATVTFDQPLSQLGTLTLMITAHNMLPYEGQVTVIPPTGPYVIFSSCIIEDALTGNGNGQLDYGETVQLTMTVENVGVATATNVNLTISSTDPLVAISDSTQYVGNINAGATATVNSAFTFQAAPNVPDEHGCNFTLRANSGLTVWESYFVCVAHAPVAQYTSHTVSDPPPGNNNGNLDPGETATFAITVTNEGSASVGNLIMTMTENDPYIVASSTPANLGTLLAGGSATGSISVQALSSCPQEYVALLTLNFVGAGGYAGTDTFSVTVGDILYAPTGPDGYGYAAYDPYDAPELPVYQWVEISADSGGLGTMVPFTLDDQTFQFGLPFTFQYYGADYDSFTIATNGWIAMGIVTQEDYNNSGIPNSDGPENMIAPYWEDLSPQRTNSGKVWQWFDATNHRLVIEYNHIEQFSPTGSFETFEVILFDPAYYSTLSGDGRIKFQYKDMSTAAQGEGTVGIENAAETIGLQYLFDGDYDLHAHPIVDGFAVMFTTPTQAANLTVTLTPYGTPIVIPANGGSFSYNIAAANPGTSQVIADIWCDITLPNGHLTGPTLGPVTLTFAPGYSINRDRSQNIPRTAPPGNYTYHGYVGDYPSTIYDQDSFPFTKSTTGDGPGVDDWANTGESFDDLPDMVQAVIPEVYSLEQNHPNPFNPVTTISFGLPDAGMVKLAVYDLLGRQVAELVNGYRPAGQHEISFDAGNLSSGIYVYRLEAGNFSGTQKMVLMK